MTDLAQRLQELNRRAEDADPVELAKIEALRIRLTRAAMVRRGRTY